jgi:hypothetical protein
MRIRDGKRYSTGSVSDLSIDQLRGSGRELFTRARFLIRPGHKLGD